MRTGSRRVQVKAKPVKQRIKIQYEGEELTIKELVGKLEYLKGSQEYLKWVVVEREKEIALLKKQLADIQPVQHGQWITEDEYMALIQLARLREKEWLENERDST